MITITMKKIAIIIMVGLLQFGILSLHAEDEGVKISKCKDTEGNWHYGNFAADECKHSVVTRMDEKGIARNKDYPPPTKDELVKLKADLKKQLAEKKKQEDKKNREEAYFRTYSSIESIKDERDRKLTTIDKVLESTRKIKSGIVRDLNQLKSREQTANTKRLIVEQTEALETYNRVITENSNKREKLKKRYEELINEFSMMVSNRQVRRGGGM